MNTIDTLRRGASLRVLETHLTPEQCAEVVRWKELLADAVNSARLQADMIVSLTVERDDALKRAEQYMSERNAARLEARREVGETVRRLRADHDAAHAELSLSRDTLARAALADKE